MEMYVDGGCRGNGYSGAIGAAACVVQEKWGRQKIHTKTLPYYPAATNQQAELSAIILALETAWNKYEVLSGTPYIQVTIHTNSKYALGCMTTWKSKWMNNGFINSAGGGVVNRDLIERAYDLDQMVAGEGSVDYVWIPREENQDADDAVNEALDDMCTCHMKS